MESISCISQNTAAIRLPADGSLPFPLTALKFSLRFAIMKPRFIPCHNAIEEVFLTPPGCKEFATRFHPFSFVFFR